MTSPIRQFMYTTRPLCEADRDVIYPMMIETFKAYGYDTVVPPHFMDIILSCKADSEWYLGALHHAIVLESDLEICGYIHLVENNQKERVLEIVTSMVNEMHGSVYVQRGVLLGAVEALAYKLAAKKVIFAFDEHTFPVKPFQQFDKDLQRGRGYMQQPMTGIYRRVYYLYKELA